MISSEPTVPPDNHEINIAAVVRAAWAHKLLVVVVTLVVSGAAVVYGLRATPIFKASVLITATHDPIFGGMGGMGMGGGLGGLASLAGLNLGVSDQDSERAAILRSRSLVGQFITQNGLLSLLFRNAKGPRTLWSAVELFDRGVLEITDDKLKETTTVSIYWTDPQIAAQWANAYVALANDVVRARAIDDASRCVDYLKKQVQLTTVVELQRGMNDLIEQQTRVLMLANAKAQYAFTVIDPAVAPGIRNSPKRTLLALSGFVLGGLLGSMIAFIYDRLRRPAAGR